MSKKRKVDKECRVFQEKWELEYFFIQHNGNPTCLICREVIAVCKDYNIKRHYESKHSHNHAQFEGKFRMDKLTTLKKGLAAQQNLFKKAKMDSESAVRASYVVSELIAKASKPFSDGAFIKNCLLKVSDLICPDKSHLFNNISLSRNTIAERIVDIAKDLETQLTEIGQKFVAFSIAVDESTDIRDIAQLALFIRGVDEEMKIIEEFLYLFPMKGTTKGEDLFENVSEVFKRLRLSWTKLIALTTDGAPAMTGKHNGLVALMQKKLIDEHSLTKLTSYHCIIHQESLCGKVIKLDHVMNVVVKTVNYIRSRGLNHRQFQTLLDEVNAQYGELLYHTDVRWLSRGAVLKRFFELRNEIGLFMQQKGQDFINLLSTSWLCDLAFLVDITQHLNVLNLKLQGRNQIITNMFDNILAFEMKLRLLEKHLLDKNFTHFPSCDTISKSHPELLIDGPSYSLKVRQLLEEFQRRFSDFHKNKKNFHMFSNPFTVDIEDAPEDLQMELIDLKCNSLLKSKFNEVDLSNFYQYLSPSSFPKLRCQAAQIMSMFGSTYLCEHLFSLMKINKSKLRSMLTDEHLQSILRVVSAQKLEPNIEKLVTNKRCQTSFSK